MKTLPSYPKRLAMVAAKERKIIMRHLKRIGLVLILALAFGSNLTAQDPSVLLEKAIYAEETMGNLDEAISIYQQIVANTDSNRATAALALFRLGICYEKSGNKAEAQAAFSKLARLYPEQRDLIAKIPSPTSEELQFGPEPWVDGEVLKLSMLAAGSSSSVGTQILSAESVHEENRSGWKLRTIQSTTGIGIYSTVWMDPDYEPARSRQKSNMMGIDIRAKYDRDRVEISGFKSGVESSNQVSLDRAVYDEAQIPFLLRCLPLQEGYKITIPVFDPSNGSIYDIKVAVVARETIEVPAGRFDCFKIVTARKNAELKYWLSSDHPFYIVKMDLLGMMGLELSSISKLENSAPTYFEDSELGIGLSVPPSWIVASSAMAGVAMVNLIDPEGESDCYMAMGKQKADKDLRTSLSEAVDKIISTYQSTYKDFEVRAGSRKIISISGATASRFIADHKALMSGQDAVQYMFAIVTADKMCQLYFTTDRDNFERMQPVFDSIANSIEIH
jgi:tetratricopeptide (TPR) repeat protein